MAYHVDSNHAEIKKALKAAGFTVVDCAKIGQGFPDLVVISPSGKVGLFEAKTLANIRPEKIENEVNFMLKLVTPVYRIVSSPEQAVAAMQEIDQ